MPVYRIETIFKEVYINEVRADSREEAIQAAHLLACEKGAYPSESFWYDSVIVAELPDDHEADND